MNLFRLSPEFTEKRKDLEGILFIETEDQGLLFTDKNVEDFWEIDYDIIKEGPKKDNNHRIENYPLTSMLTLSPDLSEVIDSINRFIEEYKSWFSRYSIITGDGVYLEPIPSPREPVKAKDHILSLLDIYSAKSRYCPNIEETSPKHLKKLLKYNQSLKYHITSLDKEGKVTLLSEEDQKDIKRFLSEGLETIRNYIPHPEDIPEHKSIEELAGDKAVKALATYLKPFRLRKYRTVPQTSGLWGKIKDVMNYKINIPKIHLPSLPSINIEHLKPIAKYSSVAVLSAGILLGSLHATRNCERYLPDMNSPVIASVQAEPIAANTVPEESHPNYTLSQNIAASSAEVRPADNTITSSSQSPQTSELIDHFRTSRIGPTSSTLYNLDNARIEGSTLSFDVPVKGNASEAFAYFGSHRTADVYSAKIDNGIA
ncbi:MAG: hypothetical protein KKE20_05975, partial [Nanoarchaeota archaeon]|nr:hypothetical protein [Nanoarchaeota archaeon]